MRSVNEGFVEQRKWLAFKIIALSIMKSGSHLGMQLNGIINSMEKNGQEISPKET